MRIIDRYIARRIIFIFITTMAIFCTMYVLIDAASNLDEIIKRKVPFLIMASYYVSSLPIMVVQTSSVACLIAALLTFGQLNSNNEIIPLRTSGMNFWQIAKPAIVFGLVVSALIFWFNEKFVPQATAMSNQIRNENIILETDTKKNKAKIKNLVSARFTSNICKVICLVDASGLLLQRLCGSSICMLAHNKVSTTK